MPNESKPRTVGTLIGTINCAPKPYESANLIVFFTKALLEHVPAKNRDRCGQYIDSIVECAIHVGSADDAASIKRNLMQALERER